MNVDIDLLLHSFGSVVEHIMSLQLTLRYWEVEIKIAVHVGFYITFGTQYTLIWQVKWWWTWVLTIVVWASYQIRKIAGCACAGNAGNVFPRRRFQRKLLVSDPGMHHGTCVTHVPWCMTGSLTCGDGENVPGIPGACAPAILRIWQEAHECSS